jgi:nucleoside-diphosphate-sugar epimerase
MTGKRILITGSCGYIGSALIRHLADRENATLRLVDNLSTGHQSALLDLPGTATYEFIDGDILDPGLLRLAVKDVDAVIHLAAVVRNPLSFDYSREFEQVNHWGTAHLVEACIEAGVDHFVYVSSTAVYLPGEGLTEDSDTRPVGSFANSVLNAEQSVRAANVRGLPATILRSGVVYGLAPQTRFDEVVNRLISLAGTGRSLTVFGEGSQRRPVLHVDDLCNAIELVIDTQKARHATFNVVESSPSIDEIKDAIIAAGPQTRVRYTEQDLRTRLSYVVDGSKLGKLGWTPDRQLSESVSEMLGRFSGFIDWRTVDTVDFA